MLCKNVRPTALLSKSHLVFAIRILCFIGALMILSGEAFGQASSEKRNDRWVSFPKAARGTAGNPNERASIVKVSALSAEKLTATASLAGMYLADAKMRDGNIYSSVIVPGAGQMEVGKPDLPAFGNWILIPNGTRVVLQVNPGRPTIYTDIDVSPVQPALPDFKGAKRPPFTKDAATYAANADYPGLFAEVRLRQFMRGQECALLWVYPFQYNPVQRALRVYPDLTVTVRFVGKPEPIPSRLKNKSFERTMHRMAANAQVVLTAEQEQAIEESSDQGEIMSDPTGCDYLIICDPDFKTAADTLAAWKNKTGFRTEVVTTDDTGSTRGEIKTYLINAYDTWNPVPQYVLFIGDSEHIPTYETYFHPSRDDPDWPQGNTGTDFIYATMGTTDTTPEYVIGRLPVDTATQATNCVNRIIDYEKTPPATASFYSNVTCAAVYQDGEDETDPPDGYADRRFAKTSEDIRNWMYDLSYSVTRIYTTENRYDNSTIEPNHWSKDWVFENDTWGGDLPAALREPNFSWNGKTSDITTAVNGGTFFLTHRDHGGRGGWSEPSFNKTNVNNLSNGTLRPVVWSINCMTGWFDNECDQDICDTSSSSESFAETWLRHSSGGAIGVIAATRISYSGRNDRLVWGWMDAIWPNFIDSKLGQGSSYPSAANNEPIYRMGDVLNYGKTYLLTKYTNCAIANSNKTWTSIQEFHWFGDPTMHMWTAQPKTLSVSKPGFSSQHKYVDVRVKDLSNNPLPGATVTLYNADSGWYSGTTDASGNIRLNLSSAVTTSFDLTVTLHDYKPHMETISIAYSDTTYPAAPTYNSAEGQCLKSVPASIDIDFSDNSNLDEVCYKVDAGGQWYSIKSGINGASYTTDWPMSSVVWSGLTQGTHYIYFKVVDDAGNETITANNTAAFEFVKDTVAPTEVSNLSPSSHTEGAYSNDNTIDVSWTAATDATSGVHGYSYLWSHSSGDDADTVEDISSSITNLTSDPLADGKWYLNIRACDSVVDFDGSANPNWGSDTHTGPFHIDTVNPQAPTYNSAEDQWFSSAPRLNIDFQDDKQLDTTSWKKKGGSTWTSIFSEYNGAIYTTDWDMDATAWNGLAEGTNYIYFKVEDDATNTYTTPDDTASFTLIKDVTAPTATYNSSEGEFYRSSAPTLDIDFSDKIGTSDGKLDLIKYRFDDSGTWITIASNISAATYTTNWQIDSTRWSGLSDGTHHIYFYIKDKAGNTTQTQNNTEAFEIVKDTQPPVANAVVTNVGVIIEGDTVYFDGTGSTDASPIAKYEWDFDNSDGIQVDATGSTTQHVYNTRGTYTATLTVYDSADNTGTDTVQVKVKAIPQASIDSITPAPSIAGQKVTFVGSGSDPDGDSIVAYNWRSDKGGQLSTKRIFSTNDPTKLIFSDVTAHNIYFKVQDSDGFWSDEVQFSLWVYVPKKWDMFKENDPRLSSQSTYPGMPHGQLNFAVGWSYLADSAITGSPVAANIDNNWINGLEIAFASSAGTLYVLDNAGKLLWSKNIGASSSSTPAIEDINDDGQLDIVVGSSNGVYAYDPNGNSIYTFNTPMGCDSSPAIADIDANSLNGKETVIGCNDGNVYAIDNSGTQLWAFSAPGGQAFTSSPALAEIDANGPAGLETVICGTDGTLYVIDSTGTQITSYTTLAPVMPINTTPAVADLVPSALGWPGPEIVFGSTDGRLYCLNYNNSTLTLIWTYPAIGNPALAAIDSSPAVGKLGEYGEIHVAFGCKNGNAYVLRTDVLPPQATWFACGGGVQVNSTPAIANIDTINFTGGPQGDLPELIFGATNGNLYAVNFALGPQNLPWSPLGLSAGQAIDSSPAVFDLNHNAELEILIGSANSRLYMIRAWSGFNLIPVAVIDPVHLGLTGQNIILDASESYDPNEETGEDYIAKYSWDINPPGYDLYETSEAVATLTWSELEQRGIHGPGDYPVELIVYDSYEEPSYPEMANIAIRDFVPPPVAEANGPYDVFVGSGVILDGSDSYAEEIGNYIVSYQWDLDDDGYFNDACSVEVALSWQDLEALGISTPGSQYTIWLKVTDKLGQESAPTQTTLTIWENQPPQVDADGPYEIEQGNPVTLEASGSDPDEPDDYIVSYQWDIDGDGVFGEYSGVSVTVPWSYLETACPGRGEDNPNPIRVRAYDTRGGYGTSPATNLYIYVNEPVAVAKANGSTEPIGVVIGQQVTFDHSESYHQWPGQHSIVFYEWDFDGNGSYDWSTSNPVEQPSYSYMAEGLYIAKLRVTDDNGPPKTAIDTIEINVANFPPVADPDGPYSVAHSDAVTLDGSASYDPDGTIVLYEWDLNNDAIFGDRMGVYPSLTWMDLEYFGITETGTTYPISLRVTDNQAATGTLATTLTITKEDVLISDPSTSVVYSDETTVTVTITDDDGENLTGQMALPKTCYLEVDDGGWQLLAQDTLNSPDDSDSTLQFTFQIQQDTVDLTPDTYPLRVRFNGDDDYNSVIQTGTLSLEKEEVCISEAEASVTYDSSVPVQLTVQDNDAENLLNQISAPKTVYLEVHDGLDWQLIAIDVLSSVDNSDCTLDYVISVGPAGVDLPSGTYALRARFDGDAYYEPAQSSGSLTIDHKEVKLVDDINLPPDDWQWETVYSDAITISLSFVDSNDENLLHQTDEPKAVVVEANDPWETIATDSLSASDNSDRTLEFLCEIQEGLGDIPPATWPIRFRFDGDSRYAACVQTGTLTVYKEDTQFVDSEGDWQWSFAETDQMTIHIELMDNDSERLYHIDDEPKIVYADYYDGGAWVNFASGQISSGMGAESALMDVPIEFTWLHGLGTFDIRFRFEGDAYYNSTTSQTATLTITPPPAILSVPSPYATIQQAIDAAGNGDIVLVADGIYTGPGNKNLSWDGNTKHITVFSENGPAACIIDCENDGRAFDFNDTSQDSTDVIDGFTINSGNADYGSGIYCYGCSVTILNCTFSQNTAHCGAGLGVANSSPILVNCAFSGNSASCAGGGIYSVDNSNLTLANCVITGNQAARQGQVGHWKFDENSGSIAGDSANDNDGVISAPTSWTAGKTGSGLYFNGGYVTVPHSSSLDITGEFTVGAWIKSTSGAGTYRAIVDKYEHSTTDDGFSFYLNNDGRLRFTVYSGSSQTSAIGTSNLRDDAWHYVVGTWNGSHIQVYVDGEQQGINAWALPPASTTQDIGIGIRLSCWGGCMPFYGTIDEVAIYNRALSDEEIEKLFDGSGGGGIYLGSESCLTITNCTLSGNSANGDGDALCSQDSNSTVVNCILWDNQPQQVYVAAGTEPVITYSDVQGGWPDEGNIDGDPRFAEPGYWDSNGTSDDVSDDFWVAGNYHLLPNSLCIDAGDNDSVPADTIDLDNNGSTAGQIPWDFDGHPRFVDDPSAADTGKGTLPIVDMGADEFPCLGDLDFSGFINFVDFAMFGLYWGEGNCDDCGGADLTGNKHVDSDDLMILLENWLAGIGPEFEAIFTDDFNDGDISDWTVTTTGDAVFEVSTAEYVSPPYSVHMNSTGNYKAKGISPVYELDISKDYNISFSFLLPHTNNHWFEVFNNHQVYLVIDSASTLKSYSPTQTIMTLETNQWYQIEIKAEQSSNSYDVYVNGQFKKTCPFWIHTGLETSFQIGDRADGSTDKGEAYWDDFVITPAY